MNIIAILHGEHRLLLKLFDWAGDLVSAKSDLGILEKTGKMVSRLMLSHSRQEEGVLFDALEPLLGKIGPMAVATHRSAHREIEKKFGEALAKSPVDAAIFSEAIAMCRTHFASEETALFPLARKILDPAQLDELGAKLLYGGKDRQGGNV